MRRPLHSRSCLSHLKATNKENNSTFLRKGMAFILLFVSIHGFAQTNTTTSGNWNTGGNWSAGVPGGGTNANVNHAMTINTNISINGGDYIINQPVTDLTGGTAYTLTIAGTGGNQGNFDVNANALFEGALNVNANGTLTVRNGDTLTVGTATFANNSTVLVEAGGTLIVNGNLTNNNNSTGITINGNLIVNGNFTGGNGSAVTGTGNMQTSGTMVTTGSGTVFGSTSDCSSGPCAGTSLETCSGNTPANPGARTGNLYTASPINPGNTSTVHWVTGTFTVTPANLTMSGTSRLVIKTGSSLTISGAYTIPTGCTIYVESGARLIVSGNLTINNATASLINLGTVNITGEMALASGAVYNDGTMTATVSLHITTPTPTFTFINGGTASLGYVYYHASTQATSSICLRPGSVFNIFSNQYIITGNLALPANGLFKYNNTDITGNGVCAIPNRARINYYNSWGGTPNAFVFGPTTSAVNTVANNSNIAIVGSRPASSATGYAVLVNSGGGYDQTQPQNFNLGSFSPVPTLMTAPAIPNYYRFCLNATVPLSGMASGSNLLWYTSATGGTGSATAPTVNTSTAGLQTFWVSQNVTGSCEGPRNPIHIDVVATAAASAVTATNNGPRCVGQSLTLTATGTGIASWSWTGPNNYTSATQSPTVSASATVAMSGTYTLITTQTTGTCLNGASTTAIVSGTTPAQPAAFTTSTSTVCPGQNNIAYTVPAVAGAISYNWTYSGTGATITGTTNSVTISFSNIATSGTLSVTATNGCGTSAARTLAITVGNISQIPTTGLIAHYKLDGNANDFLNNNAGTLQNGPAVTTDRFGIANTAYTLNGTNQHISTNNSYTNPTNFTVSLWISTTTSGGKLIGFGDSQTGQSGNYDRHVYMNNAGQIYFGVHPGAVRTIFSPLTYNDGVWHLVTASLSSTNGMKLYVDGVLVASDATTTSAQVFTGYWKIGFDNLGGWTSQPASYYFNGKIDEVLIYNTELTAGQISTLYSSPAGASSNSPVCNNGTLNLSAVTISGATYAWTGPNGFSSSAQNPSVTNMSTAKEGTYTLTVTVGSCSQTAYTIGAIAENLGPNISMIPLTGLLHQYKLNGNASDAMGTNPGALQNAPTPTSDRFGVSNKAYAFNGSSQYMSSTLTYNNPGNFTLSLWFKTTTTTGGKMIGLGGNQTGQSGNYDRHIFMNDAGQVYFGVYPGAVRLLNTTASYNDGNWHMVTASLSSSNGMSLYIDGVLVSTDPTTTTAENYTGYWRLGYDNLTGWGITASSFYFNGSLDDVLIYNRAITPSEVTTLYNATGGANNDGPVCFGSTVNLSATTIGGATYSWTGPNSFSSSVQNPSLTFSAAAAGTYTVNVSQGGCTSIGYTNIKASTVTGQWTGYTNTDWNTNTNWCNNAVPTASTDVTIPASVSNMPTNNGTANLRNLTISPSASLTNSATGTFNVYGNFANNGTYNDDGFTVFTGSTAQTLTGATTLHSVIVNNTAGVTLNSPTYVEGHLTLTAGTLASGGNLTVDLNTGAITGAGAGAISGNITVLKWIWSDKWHYISSPLSGRTVADWNDDVLIKFGANSNLYTYDETVPNTDREVGWNAVTSTATTIQDMKGYALYFPRWIYKTTIDLTGTYNHSQTYTSPTLTNTSSGNAAADGWNLMGNPYPSVIDWNAASGWTKTGLDNAIYFWDEKNTRFASYVAGIGVNGGTRYIPAMQAFYVKVSTSGGTGILGMNNNVRTTAANPDVWRIASQEKIIHLKASNSTSNNDETYVRFNSASSEDFDPQWDAYKMPNSGNTPSISTKYNNVNYAINSLPETVVQKVIPVKLVAGVSGNHTISADLTGFEENDSIVLEDRLLGISQDLKANTSYMATLVKGDTSTRFFINYKKQTKTDITTDTKGSVELKNINISAYQQQVVIEFPLQQVETADIAVFDIIGNKIYSTENKSLTSSKFEINLSDVSTGIYIVKVQTQSGSKVQQVYIQK